MRRPLTLLLTALLLTATAACGGGGSSDKASSASSPSATTIPGLSVTGKVGVVPAVKLSSPISVDKAETETVTTGTGDALKLGNDALIHLYIANGKTGKKAVTTYDQGKPVKVTMDDTKFFPALVEALTGKPSGSRVALADTVKDLYGSAGAAQIGLKATDSLVFVVDVISVTPSKVLGGPQGATVAPPAGVPSVVGKGANITNLSFAKAAKTPSPKLRTIQLVKGTGAPVQGAKIVTMNYLGEVYGAKKPFNNSYGQAPATFDVGIGGLIKGWDTALQGQRVGSRVMLIIPPKDGYGAAGNPSIKVTGTSTLAFVIDILGVG